MGALPGSAAGLDGSTVLLVLLACGAAALALKPTWRARWHWGRGGGGGPISGPAAWSLAGSLLLMACGTASVRLGLDDSWPLFLILAGFCAIIVTGLVDNGRRSA